VSISSTAATAERRSESGLIPKIRSEPPLPTDCGDESSVTVEDITADIVGQLQQTNSSVAMKWLGQRTYNADAAGLAIGCFTSCGNSGQLSHTPPLSLNSIIWCQPKGIKCPTAVGLTVGLAAGITLATHHI